MPQDFNWIDYLNLAENLIAGSNISTELEEAKLRSIVSRAYYAVYHKARTLLEEELGVLIRPDHSHTDVIEGYINGGDRNYLDVGKRLESLYNTRKDADYEKNMYINQIKAQEIIINCRQTLKIIKIIEKSLHP